MAFLFLTLFNYYAYNSCHCLALKGNREKSPLRAISIAIMIVGRAITSERAIKEFIPKMKQRILSAINLLGVLEKIQQYCYRNIGEIYNWIKSNYVGFKVHQYFFSPTVSVC